MARNEADREDLFQEATGLHRRLEIQRPQGTVIAGFRRQGGLTVYFGQDYMLGFNREGGLRRALVNGILYRAEKGNYLTQLRKKREVGGKPVLVTRLLSPAEMEALRLSARQRLAELRDALGGTVELRRVVPSSDSESLRANVRQFLAQILDRELPIADGM